MEFANAVKFNDACKRKLGIPGTRFYFLQQFRIQLIKSWFILAYTWYIFTSCRYKVIPYCRVWMSAVAFIQLRFTTSNIATIQRLLRIDIKWKLHSYTITLLFYIVFVMVSLNKFKRYNYETVNLCNLILLW